MAMKSKTAASRKSKAKAGKRKAVAKKASRKVAAKKTSRKAYGAKAAKRTARALAKAAGAATNSGKTMVRRAVKAMTTIAAPIIPTRESNN
jgi:hypothetical protein